MNRRTVLLALGAAAVVTGVVFGTGAFTQVEAERTANIAVADDSTAFLQLEGNNSNFASTTSSGGAQVVQIDLDAGSGGGGDGVNADAYTNITDIITVTNQGTQEVNVSASANEPGVGLTFNRSTLAPGDSADVNIEVATGSTSQTVNGTLPNSFSGQVDVTIEANA